MIAVGPMMVPTAVKAMEAAAGTPAVVRSNLRSASATATGPITAPIATKMIPAVAGMSAVATKDFSKCLMYGGGIETSLGL